MRLLSGGASDGMLVEVVLEAFAVTVAYGHVLLPEDYLAALYHLNALHVDDEGAVHAAEDVRGEFLLQTTHADEAEHRARLLHEVDFYIILQALNVEYVTEAYAQLLVVTLHKDGVDVGLCVWRA